MNRLIYLSKAASYVLGSRMQKRAESVTLKIPYTEEEINTIIDNANRSARVANRIPGITLGTGALAGLLGSVGLTGGQPSSGALALGAVLGGGLGAYSGWKLKDYAIKGDERELNSFLKSLDKDNRRTVKIPLKGIENMRRLQDSWLQPRAHRDYWKKVLKAYDEQIGGK